MLEFTLERNPTNVIVFEFFPAVRKAEAAYENSYLREKLNNSEHIVHCTVIFWYLNSAREKKTSKLFRMLQLFTNFVAHKVTVSQEF